MTEKVVTLYTDGACKGNPGIGGWGVLMEYGEHRKELSGCDPETTNNRMELMAAIEDLWQRLDNAASCHQVHWHWVKGHAGHPGNERADELANQGVSELCGKSF